MPFQTTQPRFRRRLVASLLGAATVFAVAAPGQNCAQTSIGAVPLNDLAGSYQGFTGGLYGNGSNVPPAAHAALGDSRMAAVVPRDATGAPAPSGRIVVLSIGMSNTTQEFSAWQQFAAGDPFRNPAVLLVDGAQGGQDAVTISNPAAAFWQIVDQRLQAAGATAQQVQVVWLKQAIAGVNGGFPAAAQQLEGLLAQIVGILRARYPKLELCFVSSRTYAGYATTQLNPEPYAYESAFGVRWLLERQIAGDPALNCDPAAGAVLAPWLAFGPYLWTDGLTPRSDGLVWACADVQPDGTHPSPAGRDKVAALLQQFFTTDPRCAPWYVGTSPVASFQLYGAGCGGAAGVPNLRKNGDPRIGNLSFRLGLDHAAPQALAALWFATQPAQLPIAGACSLLVDPGTGLPVLIGFTSPNGTRQEPLPIPNDPTLVGAQLFAQWLVEDGAGAPLPGLLGLAVSRGARIVLGP